MPTNINMSELQTGVDITAIDASKLTGALPAISGASLTNLPSSPSVGVGQTWGTVSRSSGVNYTNTTSKPILCSIRSGSVQNPGMNFYSGGATVAYHSTNAGGIFWLVRTDFGLYRSWCLPTSAVLP